MYHPAPKAAKANKNPINDYQTSYRIYTIDFYIAACWLSQMKNMVHYSFNILVKFNIYVKNCWRSRFNENITVSRSI